MKLTQEAVVDRQTTLQIELEEEDLDAYLERGYQRVVQKTAIPGFRQGKAPRFIVERFVGRESLLQEALEFMLSDATSRAVSEKQLETTGLPKFELLGLEPVSFKATVALTPEVDLGAYRDIRVPVEAVEVTDGDVDKRIEDLRLAAAVWNPVDRPVEIGDMVTMQVIGTVEGTQVTKRQDQLYVLGAGDDRPLPGFSQNLVGMVDGERKEFTLRLPEDYSDLGLAGKEAEFVVTVSEIKARSLPELDDEFAKGVEDGHESMAALKEHVRSELVSAAERRQEESYQTAALDAFVAGANIEVPPLLIEHEIEHRQANRNEMMERLRMRRDDYLRFSGITEEQLAEETRDHAVASMRREFALSTLAKLEEVEVADEEVERRLQEELSVLGDQRRSRGGNRRRREQEMDEARRVVRNALVRQKATDLLVAIARGESPVAESKQLDEEGNGPEGEGEPHG